jgi:hypothetical protein
MPVLREVFGYQVIDQWPPQSLDLNLWGILKDKIQVNLHMANN